jgi:hypothetical protein
MVDVLLTDKLSVPLMDVNIKLIYTTLAIMKCGFNRLLDIGARLGINSHNERVTTHQQPVITGIF